MEVQVRLYREFCRVVPVTSACFEMGKFDTQALKAVLKGDPVPEGEGYQKGERYGTDTLRAAVFLRAFRKGRGCPPCTPCRILEGGPDKPPGKPCLCL